MRSPLSQPGFLTALLFALLGGVILNLMPCVFPVLSLKILAVRNTRAIARQRWTGALAYTAGVVLSFLALAGLLIAARAGGEQLGWGFQLQAPGTVVAPGGAVHAHRPQPRRRVRVRLAAAIGHRVAARARSHARFVSDRRAGRGSRFSLHGAVHGRRAGRRAYLAHRAEPHGVRRAGPGVAAPYLLVCAVPAVGRWLPRPGRVDADFPGGAGLSDVRHRHLAGLGAGPPGRCRRRRRPAGGAAGAGAGGLVVGATPGGRHQAALEHWSPSCC